MLALITGSTGFIGQRVTKELPTVNFFCLTRKLQDLSQPLKIKPIAFDCIIHLAQANSQEPRDLFNINTKSTLELLEYGRQNKIKKFIYFSTGNVYGFNPQKVSESDQPRPLGIYGATKLAAEELCWQYQQYFDVIILRLFTPYGPSQQTTRLIPSIIKKIQTSEPIIINNDIGNPRITPIYITDVVQYLSKTLDISGSYRLNIGGKESYSILEISKIIGELTGKKPIYQLQYNKQIGDLMTDIKLSKKVLSYSPQVKLVDGLKQMLCEKKY